MDRYLSAKNLSISCLSCGVDIMVKALGSRDTTFKDIEVLNTESGRPTAVQYISKTAFLDRLTY